jgi:hypothetical protein
MEFLSGLVGVFIGALLSSFFTRRESQRQTRINTTLKMYERLQGALPSRLIADQILKQHLSSENPLTYREIKSSLNPEQWQHISTTRNIFSELGLLYRAGYLDIGLAKVLFAPTFRYWYETHLLKLEVSPIINDTNPMQWVVPPDEIASWLLR